MLRAWGKHPNRQSRSPVSKPFRQCLPLVHPAIHPKRAPSSAKLLWAGRLPTSARTAKSMRRNDGRSAMNDPIAERLSKALEGAYTIEGEIGRGGMGVVYHARDERLKRRVAIKVLPPELAFRDEIRLRFLREAETAARLSHPHIVPIHSVGEGPEGLTYFVMAYVDGEPLGARLKRRGRLPAEEARRILIETADALGAAHAVGIVHRDVKPDNILLEGSRGRVMVTDFGIAKALTSTSGAGPLTATGAALGTPHYMSPEQAAGERDIDGRSDLYSLGVVAYQMLTGALPFEAPTVPGILFKQVTEAAPSILARAPECPEDLASCVMRCLEKDPERRWPTGESLRRALESRSVGPYRPAARRVPALAAPPPRDRITRGERRAPRGGDAPAPDEPAMVRRMRGAFVSWASVCGGLIALDLATGWGGWSLWPTLMWGGFGIVPRYLRLWNAGYSWRDVLHRPAAPDAADARRVAPQHPHAGVGDDDLGRFAPSLKQARLDRAAILKIVGRVPPAERAQLPDVVATADALLNRAEQLARAAHGMGTDVSEAALTRIDARLAAAQGQPDGAERARQVQLLERQRQTLAELLVRRQAFEGQVESYVLAMQNVRFDLLRLRSAGVSAVLDDLTHATQQARALSREVDHAIEAAGEVRDLLGQLPRI